MSSDEVLLAGRVPQWMKDMVDADPRDNQEVLRVALRKELGGERDSELQVKLDQLDQRIEMLEDDREELAEQKTELEQKRARIQSQIEKGNEVQEQKIEEAADVLEEAPADPTHPGVQNWADKVGLTPQELANELQERRED